MFALTVVFGLFHGLVLFPVVLSLTGSADKMEPSHNTNTEPFNNSTMSISSMSGSSPHTRSTVSSTTNSPKEVHDNLAFVDLDSDKKHDGLDQHWVTIDKNKNVHKSRNHEINHVMP